MPQQLHTGRADTRYRRGDDDSLGAPVVPSHAAAGFMLLSK
jgi:hypothetical protein